MRNPFEAGLSRSWYRKGQKAGRSGKYGDMYDAWHAQKAKPSTPGGKVTAQESFYQGYMDVEVTKSNPWIPARAVQLIRDRQGRVKKLRIRR